MDTVTALTLARMLQIESNLIVDGDIVGDDLVLTRYNGTVYDGGVARGPAGRAAGFITELGYSVDLDMLLEPGFYAQSSNIEAGSGTNYPVPYAGLLKTELDLTLTMKFQTYTVYNGGPFAGMTFTRVYLDGAWLPWAAHGSGPWISINAGSSSGWISYGLTWQTPRFRVTGSMVKLSGLIKSYYLNDWENTFGGYCLSSAGPGQPTYPELMPKVAAIFRVNGGRTAVASTALSHNHDVYSFVGRLDVYPNVDNTTNINAGSIVIPATTNAYYAEGAHLSLDGVAWDWMS